MIKSIKLLAIAAICSTLSSCALLTSALQLPGSILTTAGRTLGLPVNHEEAPKTEAEKLEQEEQTLY